MENALKRELDAKLEELNELTLKAKKKIKVEKHLRNN